MKKLNLNLWEKAKTAFWSSDHAFNLPLLAALLFLLPTQFGRHFWFPFSYVHGLRIDYLAITLYSTDILILLLLADLLFRNRPQLPLHFKRILKYKLRIFSYAIKTGSLVLGLAAFMLLNTFLSVSPWLSVYGWVKVLEMMFFGSYVYFVCKDEKRKSICLRAFVFGVMLQAFLALLQYLQGSSLGGLWYFFGERMYNGNTPGIANAAILGQLILRPYGTLPHPNVLAAYLLVGIFILLFTPRLFAKLCSLLVTASIVLFFLLVLGLTLSRTALVLLPFLFFCYFARHVSKKQSLGIVGILLGVFLMFSPFLLGRFMSLSLVDQSVITREFYLLASLKIIRAYPLLGSGLFSFLPSLGKTFSVISYDLLQPVHSLPMLVISELGIPAGFMLTIVTVWGLFVLVKRRLYRSLLLSSLLLFLSLFDHYFWTVQQGQLLLSFCLVLAFRLALKSDEKIEKTTISKAMKRKI